MRNQLSFRQYRQIDLGLFGVILCLCEGLILLAATRWFPAEPYVLSVTGAVCAVILFRWGGYAAIHAVLGGGVLCALSGAPWTEYLVYCGGNLLCLLALLPLKKFGWKKIRDNVYGCVVFGLLVTVLMQTGRALITLLLSGDLSGCLLHYTTDVLSGFFSMLVMWITRRLDGILEDQRHYIKRISRELSSETDSKNAGRMEL